MVSSLLLAIAFVNQHPTEKPFFQANMLQSRANLHLDSMSRNSRIINAMAMIPEAVALWGRDTARALTAQVRAQDRNIMTAAVSRTVRLLTQVGMLGWGAHLALHGQITGGMVTAASIIAGRALAPIEKLIEDWNAVLLSRASYGRITTLLRGSKLIRTPPPSQPPRAGWMSSGCCIFPAVPSRWFEQHHLLAEPGESLGVIGNYGEGKTTAGKMLVGSILPTSGNV